MPVRELGAVDALEQADRAAHPVHPPRTGRPTAPPRLPEPEPVAALAAPHTNGHKRRSETVEPLPFDTLVHGRGRGTDGPGTGNGTDTGAPDSTALGPDGLPHRVRQANLAPQLRVDPTPGTDAAAPTPGGSDSPGERPPRTPEQNRATMAAFQRGFNRGRSDGPGEAPGPARDAAGDETDHRGEDTR